MDAEKILKLAEQAVNECEVRIRQVPPQDLPRFALDLLELHQRLTRQPGKPPSKPAKE
jgi:hypothetical protein